MIPVVAIGTDKKLEKELFDYFSKRPATILQKNRLHCNGTEFLLLFREDPNLQMNVQKGLLLFYSSLNITTKTVLPKKMIGICESTNKAALSLLMKNGNTAVTFGLAATDTITFSSLGETTSQLSLQREIRDVNGHIVEPFEFSLPHGAFSKTAELMIGTIEILCGE